MIPNIDFIRPENLDEVTRILADHKQDARLLAGGTDIVPGFQIQSSRFDGIKILVDIHRLDDLTIIENEDGFIRIGAAVNFSRLSSDEIVKTHLPILAKAALSVGCPQIRNRATVGGNFVNNAPCADSVPALLVYDTMIHIQSATGTREISLAQFLEKPYKTQLKADEIVTHLRIPIPNESVKGDFYKLGRRRGAAISRISLALIMRIEKDIIKDLRLASGAVTPIGKRFTDLEDKAKNQPASTPLFKQLAYDLGKEILDITGLRWSSPYKLPVVQQCFYQLLENVYASHPLMEEKE
jgi:carbon-monoxide dehydrogenase medium subunit/xanthine dehydrogenase FAD-binding subunit